MPRSQRHTEGKISITDTVTEKRMKSIKHHPFQKKFSDFCCILIMDIIFFSVQPRKLVTANTNTNNFLKLLCNTSKSESSEVSEGCAFCITNITEISVA